MDKEKRVKACEDWMKTEGYQPAVLSSSHPIEVPEKADHKLKNCWFDENEKLFHCLMQDGTEWTSPTGSDKDEWTRVPKKAPSVDPVPNPLSRRFGELFCEKPEGFTKNDSGKLQWSLLPFEQLKDVVKVLMLGAKKYSPDNWKRCDDVDHYKDTLMRHVISYVSGDETDEESGHSHLAHAICNCLFLMWFDDHQEKAE